jgi:capsular polysaccharide biosynthesis protein
VEIDEVAARLARQYWALLVICTFLPVVVVALTVMREPSVYAADARIITSSEVPATAAQADAIVSQVQGIATGLTSAGPALRNAGIPVNVANSIVNNVTVNGLGTSQVVDVMVTDPSPQVAQKAARVLGGLVVNALNKVSQGGLSATLAALDSEIVSLTEQRSELSATIAQNPQDQQLQAKLAGLDEVISNFTSDRGRLLIQASTQGLADVIAQPGLPQAPESKALGQKLGLAALLGLVLGILLAAIAETIRPTVPGARRVSRRLSSPMLGTLTEREMHGTRTFKFDNVALQVRLAAANASVSTVALVDIEGRPELGDLADQLTHAMPPASPALRAGVSNGSGHGAMPAESCPVRVLSLGQLQRRTDIDRAGIVVLSGPVAKLSRISALSDLSAASGWPIIGVVGVPRTRSNWQKPLHDHETPEPPAAAGAIAGGVADPVAQTTGRE